jgi:hypothetical protein
MAVKLVLLLALSVMAVGCGEPYEKKAEREKAAREDRTRKVEAWVVLNSEAVKAFKAAKSGSVLGPLVFCTPEGHSLTHH